MKAKPLQSGTEAQIDSEITEGETMNIDHAVLIITIVLAIVLGEILAQICLLELAKRRRKQLRKQSASMPRPKPEPQKIEFNMVLSGVDDVEAGLARVKAALSQIAKAAEGVPITVNNYYDQKAKPWRYYCPRCRGVFEGKTPSKPGLLVVRCPDCGYQSLVGGSEDKWYTINPDRLQDDVELCSYGCHYEEPYGFVPMAGCPVHD